jgi:hypothetical protein
VWGIGFKTADTIARAIGIPHDSPQRIKAGLQYTLSQAADNGHCYLPQPNLITDATKILEVDRELIGPCLDELATAGGAVRELVPGEGGDLGAGEVLRDLLAAGAIPRVCLTRIFRQVRQSGIVVNAHRINHGQPPRLTGFGDFYWFAYEPPEDSGLHHAACSTVPARSPPGTGNVGLRTPQSGGAEQDRLAADEVPVPQVGRTSTHGHQHLLRAEGRHLHVGRPQDILWRRTRAGRSPSWRAPSRALPSHRPRR